MIKALKLCAAALISVLLLFSFCGCDTYAPREEQYDGYTLYRNYRYGIHKRNMLDVALPDGATGELGLVLMIHGGGWHAGDKEVYEGELAAWASRGYAAAAINYRYASKSVHAEDILDDIEAALSYVKKHAEGYGITLNGVILTGGSAGGHLSLLYAYSRGESSPIEPRAVISYSGPIDLYDENFYAESEILEDIEEMISKISGTEATRERREDAKDVLSAASPTSYVASAVPTVICHGTDDPIVPVSNAYTLDELLTAQGVEHELIIFKNSGHGLEADPDSTVRANDAFLEYAQKYLKRAHAEADQ